MPPKSVALVGAICVTIGWLLASTVSPPVARVQSRPQPQETQAQLPDPSQLTEQLQLRLRQLPAAPPVRRRNPFVFATRDRIEAPVSELQPARLDPEPTMPTPGTTTLSYVLSGIGISGDVRSAVLTTGGDVHIVKVNDVLDGFTVVDITDSSVTLAKEGERVTLRFTQ